MGIGIQKRVRQFIWSQVTNSNSALSKKTNFYWPMPGNRASGSARSRCLHYVDKIQCLCSSPSLCLSFCFCFPSLSQSSASFVGFTLCKPSSCSRSYQLCVYTPQFSTSKPPREGSLARRGSLVLLPKPAIVRDVALKGEAWVICSPLEPQQNLLD